MSKDEFIPSDNNGHVLEYYYFLGYNVDKIRHRMNYEIKMGYIDSNYLIVKNDEDHPDTLYDSRGGRAYTDPYNLTTINLPVRTFREWIMNSTDYKRDDLKLNEFLDNAQRVRAVRV